MPTDDSEPKGSSGPEEIEDELVVTLEDGVEEIEAEAQRVTSAGVDIVDTNETLNMALARIRPTAQVADSASEAENVESERTVKDIEPNVRVQVSPPLEAEHGPDAGADAGEDFPNDPLYNEQAGPPLVNAPEAWELTNGDSDVTIAVLDTGVKYDHEDLADNMGVDDSSVGYGRDIINFDSDPYPESFEDPVESHGTSTAGIVGAVTDNDVGVAGISDCTVLSVRVLGPNGVGDGWDIVEGIQWAASNGADIINLSLGSEGEWGPYDDAISYADDQGVLTIASAGNDGTEQSGYSPGSQAHMAVGASGWEGEELADFSNYGDYVNVVAPGVGGYTTYPAADGEPADEYDWYGGTSMAAPVVAGIAGLILSVDDTLSVEEVREIIEETATDMGLPDEEQGSGLVDAEAAVRKVIEPEAAGVVGANVLDGEVTDVYWDTETTEASAGIDFDDGDGDATALTTAQMKGESAEDHLAEFDFEETWATDPDGYPIFQWQVEPPDNPDISVQPIEIDDVTPEESFTVDVTLEETAGLTAESVTVTLTVEPSDSDTTVYDQVIDAGELSESDETTVTFGEDDGTTDLGPFEKGEYTAVAVADATNAESTETTQSFAVDEERTVDYYTDDDGNAEPGDVFEAIDDWRNDEIDAGIIFEVIEAWRS